MELSVDKNQEMLQSGSFTKLLLKLSLPAVIVMLVTVLYNMADTFFIGQTGDPNKINAVSLSSPIFSIISGLGTLLGSGGCTAISLQLGKGEYGKVKSITSFCCAGSVLIGILFAVFVPIFLEPICRVLGADNATLKDTCDYLFIIAVGSPFVIFNTVFSNIIRANGAAIASMVSNVLGTAVNIILDAVFIVGLSLDVKGAALATVVGNACGCIFLVFYICKKQKIFSLNPKNIRFKYDTIVPVLTLGLPMTFSTILMSLSHVLSNRLMMGHDPIALAAQQVSGKIGMLITMLIIGICMGLQPAISYNFGSKNLKRMSEIIRKTVIFTVSLGAILAVICFFARDTVIRIFIDDAEVIAYGSIMVLASLITGPLYAVHQTCQTFLQSTGKASFATFVAVLDKGLFFIPVLYILNYFFGAYGIVFTGAVTLVFSLAVSVALSIFWLRKVKKQNAASEPVPQN